MYNIIKRAFYFVLLLWLKLRWTHSLPYEVDLLRELPNEHRIAWQELRDEGTYIGLLHFLYENVIPPPHFLVHELYVPQEPQLPSTGFNLRFFTHWPLMHHCDLKVNETVTFISTTPYSCHVFTDRSTFSLNLSRIQIPTGTPLTNCNHKHGLMLTCRHVHVRPHCFILTAYRSMIACRLELAYLAGKIS